MVTLAPLVLGGSARFAERLWTLTKELGLVPVVDLFSSDREVVPRCTAEVLVEHSMTLRIAAKRRLERRAREGTPRIGKLDETHQPVPRTKIDQAEAQTPAEVSRELAGLNTKLIRKL